jgi:hypothetical protein
MAHSPRSWRCTNRHPATVLPLVGFLRIRPGGADVLRPEAIAVTGDSRSHCFVGKVEEGVALSAETTQRKLDSKASQSVKSSQGFCQKLRLSARPASGGLPERSFAPRNPHETPSAADPRRIETPCATPNTAEMRSGRAIRFAITVGSARRLASHVTPLQPVHASPHLDVGDAADLIAAEGLLGVRTFL